MIPTVLAILIYQILAILAGEAISQTVTAIAYKRRDLDFKLMYAQSPLDLLTNYQRFDKKLRHKFAVILFACVAIALKFIPTIFTKLNSPGSIYLRYPGTPLVQQEAVSQYGWPSTMPIFNNFVSFLSNNSFQDMMLHYIEENLRQNTTQNSDGHWFRPQTNINRYEWNDRQTRRFRGFEILDGNNSIQTFMAFGDRRPKQALVGSGFSILNSRLPDSNIVDIRNSRTNGISMVATKSYLGVCYPVYDVILTISVPNIKLSEYKPSLLDANNTIYRPGMLSAGTLASSSVGVSIFSHNATHLTMGIKKSAHITLYSYEKVAVPPSNCSSEGRSNHTNNFIDLPYNGVLCDMMRAMNNHGNISAIQAVAQFSRSNYIIDMAYTHIRGLPHEKGDKIMIDYTMIQAFNVEGVLPDKKERLVAYESKKLQLEDPTEGPIAVNLSDNKIGLLLKELDPSYIDQQSIDYLVRMASMRVRWENGDYSDFYLTKALVIDAVETPTWWIITVILMTIAFLIPQATRLFVRRIPEYSKDLRTLLLLTLKHSSEFRGTSKAKNVGISVNELNNKADRVALLTVNDFPVSVGEKMDVSKVRLIDEGITYPTDKMDRYE
ncbi:hypothetical protein HMPREF1544_04059 [Mucor circinelloides 1006PhL]|uniref:Uncharacterized protein n=1 Tax=Mucor circinelloides f. circinelloides (strain 1006PhL) TaxID=1220926 RepID=S2K1M3_MUCC1|nr:hypothetical protein HMPREF1544_04059 [Mucor circinelloides 1006PhL]